VKRLQNLSYKTLLIIFFFSLAGIVFFLKIGGKTTKVSAAWWDDAWHYRIAVTITNNTGYDATNIPYKANLDTQTLISAGKLQSDADDIRVVDTNGNIVRSQVEKSSLNSTATKVWFEATVKNGNSATYYIYYGNSTASAPNFPSDIQSFSNTSSGTTISMKDGFGYTTTNTNGGRLGDVTKNGTETGVDGNINYSNSFPGQWWTTSTSQTILNSTGPLFIEVVYSSGATGSYSAYESDVKVFDNGFSETRLFVTYNASGSEQFYYYLPFTNGTRNSVWVNGSGTLVDQAADSGTLYQADLGQNWFGQRWTATGNYGGTIITKNGSDWYNGYTSAQASYFQTNYSTTLAFTSGSTREVRFGVFSGNGGLTEMAQKGANYGGLSSSINTEEIGGAPIAYWKFDETTGTTAYDSSGTNNGTITNATSTTEDQCISGKCLYFNGTANVVIPNSPSLQITGNQTISMWIKPTSFSTQCNPFNKAYGGEGTITLETNSTLTYYWGTAGADNNPYQGFSSNGLSLNNWNYVSLVRDITNNKLTWYINGKVNSSGTPSYSQATASTANLILGSGYAGSFTGYLDEVKIYPYARTADQIKQDYNSRGSLAGAGVNLGVKSNTAPNLKSSLVAHYKFDEGVGTTIYDSSGNNLTGVFATGSSAPTWINEGKNGKALSFNANESDNFVLPSYLGNNTNFGGTEGVVTFSMWIYVENDNTNITISNFLGGGWTYWGLNASGIIQGMVQNCTASANYWPTSNSSIPLNTWTHIVSELSGQGYKFYINGKLDKSVSDSSLCLQKSGTPKIGLDNVGWGNFTGKIDNLKVYNRVLTPEEIKQDYNQGSAIQFGQTTQNIGGTTTSLDYCIPGDTSYCATPVAEWNFEENTGTVAKDTSGNNYNGTIYSATWATGQKNKGSSLKFDGTNSYVDIGSSFGTLSSYTISFWAKHNTTGRMPFGSKGNVNFYWYGDNSWRYVHGGTAGEYYYPHQVSIPTGTWGYFTATYDGAKVSIYRNGVFEGSQSTSGSADFSSGFLIGSGYTDNSTYRFIGQIDNVKIYNYARTPAQVAYDYNRGNPIAWWKFDECQGSTVFDSSGLGSSGVVSIGQSGTQTSLGTCQSGTSAAWTNGSSGHSNGSLSFDGSDDYVTIPSSIAPKLGSSNFTVSFWTYRTASGYQYGSYLSKGTYTNGIDTYDNIFRVNTSAGELAHVTLNASLNKWEHHLFVINQNSTPYISHYINGILNNTGYVGVGNTGTYPADSYDLVIGKSTAGGVNRLFNGQIDDVRFYNYTLTQEQIKQVYNGSSVSFQ
jgi:hypothetical protein